MKGELFKSGKIHLDRHQWEEVEVSPVETGSVVTGPTTLPSLVPGENFHPRFKSFIKSDPQPSLLQVECPVAFMFNWGCKVNRDLQNCLIGMQLLEMVGLRAPIMLLMKMKIKLPSSYRYTAAAANSRRRSTSKNGGMDQSKT